MARTTTLTGVITLATKQIVITETIAIREKANLHLTGYGTAGATDLIAAIVYNGALMVKLQGLTDYTTYIGGVLNLNTDEIVEIFSGKPANTKIKMNFVIWDATNECTLVNDFIWVQNNPYSTDMEATTPVDPIGNVEYAPIANGVTNGDSHTHQNGDGADLEPYYIVRVPTGGNFRQSTNDLNLELKDVITGTWYKLNVAAGAVAITEV